MEDKQRKGYDSYNSGGGAALPKIITDEELERFFYVIDHSITRKPLFWKTLFYCAAYMGLRQAEALKVNIKDIDWLEKTLLIRHQKNKNNFEKVIIPDEMIEILKNHIEIYGNKIEENEGYLFFSNYKNRNYLSVSVVRHMTEKVRRKAKLDESYGTTIDGREKKIMSFHTLRHYYAQRIVDTKGIFAAKTMLRHTNINTTMRYSHSSLKKKREIADEVFNKQTQESLIEEIKTLRQQLSNNGNGSFVIKVCKCSEDVKPIIT